MSQPLGIVGFGRVARNLLRLLWDDPDFPVAALAAPGEPEAVAYLLEYDTLLGRLPQDVRFADGSLYRGEREIRLLPPAAGEVPEWGGLGVHTVVVAAGEEPARKELQRHIEAGAQRVVLCVPPAETPDATVVLGINDDRLQPEHRIVSNASNTVQALAPLLQILDRNFGVERAFVDTVHAYTEAQRLADVPAADPRRGRAASENIIPQESQTVAVLAEVLPELAGRVTALALNVPVAHGSAIDLVCWHRRDLDLEELRLTVAGEIANHWQGRLRYETDPLVSSDIHEDSHSGVFDADAAMTLGPRVSKTLTWFDDGWGYAHRLLDLLRRFQEVDA